MKNNIITMCSIVASFATVVLCASENGNQRFRRNIVTGRGNVIIQDYRNGYSEIFRCGQWIDQKTDSVKVNNVKFEALASDIKTQKIQLTGVKKRVPLQGTVDTVALPSGLGEVVITHHDSYMECDEAVFGSDLKIQTTNGVLGYQFKKNAATKFKGTGGKPLCSIYEKLNQDGILKVNHSSRVKINTPFVRTIQANYSAVVADKNVKLNQLQVLDINNSATVDLPNISVPVLRSYVNNSAKVTLAGEVENHEVNVHNSALLDASRLKSEQVTIDTAHYSKVALWVTKALQGFASYNSQIFYTPGRSVFNKVYERVGTSWGATCTPRSPEFLKNETNEWKK